MNTCAVMLGIGFGVSVALGQAAEPTVFVANQGNLEGSVSSFAIEPDGTPVLVDKVVTGARASINDDNPGTNTIALSVSPNGRFLATGHATGSLSGDYVSIIGVGADATLTLLQQHLMPQTTFSVEWIDDQYLAVLQTEVFATNELVIFAFNAGDSTLKEVSRAYCGTFATKIVKNAARRVVYVNDSGTADSIYAFAVGEDGSLAQIQNMAMSIYPLGIEGGPEGKGLFAAGGISSGGHAFSVFRLDEDGLMSPHLGNPFTSPGSSPKGFSVDPSGTMLFVEHGSDATIRSFFLDPETMTPTSTGRSFDVGLQGTLGGSAAWGGYLFVTDESTAIDGLRGLYSLAIDYSTGAMSPVTPTPVDTTGITPESVRVWAPAGCDADINGDGELDFFDVLEYLDLFSAGDEAADLNGDGVLDFFDVADFLDLFSGGCP